MKKTAIIGGVCLLALVILFLFTDPNKTPSLILVLPFVLLFATLASVASMLLQRLSPNNPKSLRIGLLCAAVPTALLILQSIGQLTFKDVLIIGALFPVSYFYMYRLSTSS
jgi:hypothetical protein